MDFGIYDANVRGYRNDDVNDQISEERRDFVNGYRSTTLLDFNVDGNIWELMWLEGFNGLGTGNKYMDELYRPSYLSPFEIK